MDDARIVLQDGTTIGGWTEYRIDSDFLTPTDGWSFSYSHPGAQYDFATVRPDAKVGIRVGGVLQLTGWVDSVRRSSSSSGGLQISVSGRDVLKVLCKANVPPDLTIKNKTVLETVEHLVNLYYKDPPTVYYGVDENRLVMGLPKGSAKNRTKQQKKLVDYCQPHPNEGCFEFMSRIIRRFGLWVWATADGGIVVSGPDYDQAPSYSIVRRRGGKAIEYPTATYTHDRTSVPSYMLVRGKAKAKEWAKGYAFGEVKDSDADTTHYDEPSYVQHDEAVDGAEAAAFARQELSRLKQNEKVYECTAVGHHDRVTGNVFALDTIATVDDEILQVKGDFYVIGRTFNKSVSGGTTTDLRMVPPGAIQFSDVDAP